MSHRVPDQYGNSSRRRNNNNNNNINNTNIQHQGGGNNSGKSTPRSGRPSSNDVAEQINDIFEANNGNSRSRPGNYGQDSFFYPAGVQLAGSGSASGTGGMNRPESSYGIQQPLTTTQYPRRKGRGTYSSYRGGRNPNRYAPTYQSSYEQPISQNATQQFQQYAGGWTWSTGGTTGDISGLIEANSMDPQVYAALQAQQQELIATSQLIADQQQQIQVAMLNAAQQQQQLQQGYYIASAQSPYGGGFTDAMSAQEVMSGYDYGYGYDANLAVQAPISVPIGSTTGQFSELAGLEGLSLSEQTSGSSSRVSTPQPTGRRKAPKKTASSLASGGAATSSGTNVNPYGMYKVTEGSKWTGGPTSGTGGLGSSKTEGAPLRQPLIPITLEELGKNTNSDLNFWAPDIARLDLGSEGRRKRGAAVIENGDDADQGEQGRDLRSALLELWAVD
ncbi:uncharacterized protein V1516DRAFT_475199 [Lipomyces oligophaga]|uniref:uncharacterized protein n=1 Tax=Lipomyces oligophaga TaxID=45792 RepID=UPI0034CDE37F